MSDYIKREDAVNALDKLCDTVCPYSKKQRSVMCGACTLGGAFDVLDELPSADVVERKVGRWVYGTDEETGEQDIKPWTCSLCREKYPWQPNYCPNCGAEMRGESD